MKTLAFKRKREGKTNYHKRLSLLKSQKPRLVVRRSLKNIQVQIIEFKQDGDHVISTAHSRELVKSGWKGSRSNIPAAYLTGYLAAKKAIAQGVKEAIFDLGLAPSIHGNKLYAALQGGVDAGLQIKHDPKVFPSEERITGTHISKDLKKEIEAVKGKLKWVKNQQKKVE